MTIRTDGARSLKRLPMAKKLLERIVDMDLPAKATVIEGFTYKVWQMDGISGGWIASPDGIFILGVADGRVKQFVCDSYEAPALPIFSTLDGGRHIMAPLPVPTDGSYGSAVGGVTAGQSIVAESYQRPFCLPFAGEGVLVAVVGDVGTTYYNTVTAQVTNCLSNGASDIASPGVSEFIYSFGPHRIVPLQASAGHFSYLQWNDHIAVPFNNFQDFMVTTQLAMDSARNYSAAQITGRTIYPDAPTEFWTLTAASLYNLTGGDEEPHIRGLVALGFPTSAKGVVAVSTDLYYWPLHNPGASVSAATAAYRVTLSFFETTATPAVTTVKFDVLEPILHALLANELPFLPEYGFEPVYTLADPGDGHIAWKQCGNALAYLAGGSGIGFSAGKNCQFSDSAGVAHAWVRATDPAAAQDPAWDTGFPGRQRNGGFRFSPTAGIERVALAMPAPVLASADEQPELTLLTAGATPADSVYLCVSKSITTGNVSSVHVGSPFGSWSSVALPPGALKAVRPTNPATTAAGIEFLAVGALAAGGHYIFTRKAGAWVRLAKIPVADGIDARWDVCPFGAGAALGMFNIRQFPGAM